MFSIDAAKAALERLPSPVRQVIRIFAERPISADKRKDLADPQWALDSPTLWSLTTQGYSAWICRLVYALLLQTKQPLLAMCRGVAQQRAPLAELLLPHVLADLAAADANGSFRRTLSEKVMNQCC